MFGHRIDISVWNLNHNMYFYPLESNTKYEIWVGLIILSLPLSHFLLWTTSPVRREDTYGRQK